MGYSLRMPNLWFGIIISDDGAKLSRLYYRNEKSNNHATKIYRNIKYLQVDLRIKTFKPQIRTVSYNTAILRNVGCSISYSDGDSFE